MSLSVVTPPVEVPVTLQEYKDHMRVDISDDDALIAAVAQAAVSYTEQTTTRTAVKTTYQLVQDSICNNVIELPRSDATAITSVVLIDVDGTPNVVSPTVYTLNSTGLRHFVVLNVNQTWPSIQLQAAGGVQVIFDAGFADAESVPEDLKSALKFLVSHLYEFREPYVTGLDVKTVPLTYDALVDQFSVPRTI